jgi:hypothetical protein
MPPLPPPFVVCAGDWCAPLLVMQPATPAMSVSKSAIAICLNIGFSPSMDPTRTEEEQWRAGISSITVE